MNTPTSKDVANGPVLRWEWSGGEFRFFVDDVEYVPKSPGETAAASTNEPSLGTERLLARETTAIQWVPIGERRPVDMATVLVHSAHMQSRVGTDSAFLVRKLWACAKQDAEECYYSHWAPLPAPPSLTPTTRGGRWLNDEDATEQIGAPDPLPTTRKQP